MLPRTTEGMEHVCYFRHALALDERRVKFLPEYVWQGSHLPDNMETAELTKEKGKEDGTGTNPPDTETAELTKEKGKEGGTGTEPQPKVKEVWFAGTHADV
jgi:hypothetical protein